MSQFYEAGHLGGCIKGGDPATFYPNMWDFFISQTQVKSILDIGCGEGHALNYLQKKCPKVRGIEGCAAAIAASDISHKIIQHDFTKDWKYLPEGYEMIWCCEFVEHLEEQYIENFLSTVLFSGSKYVLMTHAFPGQGGYHHVNCQAPSYWIEAMAQIGFSLDTQLTRMCRAVALMEHNSPYNHFARSGLVFKHTAGARGSNVYLENLKQDAVITWASGKDFCKCPGFKVYMNSLNRSGFSGDKLVFTHDMEIEDREYVTKQGFKIIDVNPKLIKWVVRDRFLAWSNFLAQTNYRYVAFLDAKDVVCQRDPIKALEELDYPHVCFISEGKLHSDCNWNTGDQQNLQSQLGGFQQDCASWDVLCAGTILGCAEYVRQFIMQIWSTTLFNTKATDQAVLNYLYHTFIWPNQYVIADPRYDAIAVTADLPKDKMPRFENNQMIHDEKNIPYAIYHQWDRVPGIKEKILETYL